MMIERGCPRCSGAIYVESFKAEGKTYVEIKCITCARIWSPGTMDALLASLRENGYTEKAAHVKKLLDAAISKEVGSGKLVI